MSGQSYYATVPSWILSHKELSYGEKLMCALLSAMSQKNGYCFATNEAISIALGTTSNAVMKMLTRLDESNVIAIHNKKTKKSGNRQIRLVFAERIDGDVPTEEAPASNEIDNAFDLFYSAYPRKEKKMVALKTFKSKKLHKRIIDLINAAKNYASKMSDKDPQFVMLPSTFLNNQIWEEYVYQGDGQKISNGAAVAEDKEFNRFMDALRERWIELERMGESRYDYRNDPIFDNGTHEDRAVKRNGGMEQVMIEYEPDEDFIMRMYRMWEATR